MINKNDLLFLAGLVKIEIDDFNAGIYLRNLQKIITYFSIIDKENKEFQGTDSINSSDCFEFLHDDDESFNPPGQYLLQYLLIANNKNLFEVPLMFQDESTKQNDK